ncbi:hypothetical protein ACI703_14460 [Isoptericola jiangsuensis]|uniref:hypothetical protein n=1 Tax=Isoptericola jiangsuensis TaxID=548579 RepID=UPI00386B4FC6
MDRKKSPKGPRTSPAVDDPALARVRSHERAQLIDEILVQQLKLTKALGERRRNSLSALSALIGAAAAASALLLASWLKG